MASTGSRDARAAIVAVAAGEIHHDDAGDVVDVVARAQIIALAAGDDRKRCFSQRSWELTQHARASKEKKRHEQKRADLELELEGVRAALTIGDFQCGAIVASGQAAGVLSERDLSLLTLEAATSPTVRGSTDACERRRLLQDRSAAALAAFAEAAQETFFLDVLTGGRATASESAPWAAASNFLDDDERRMSRCIVWCGTLDSSRHRTRAVQDKSSAQTRATVGQVGVTFLMQSATYREVFLKVSGTAVTIDEPWISRGLVIEQKSANYIVEAVVRRCPLPLTSPQDLRELTLSSDAQYFSWTLDRAAENFGFMRWVNDIVAQLPASAACHMELCTAHGVPLVKGRSPEGKAVSAHLHSFSVFLRNIKSLQSMMKCLETHVTERTVVVRRQPRPPGHAAWSQDIIRCLFGPDSDDILFATRRDGSKQKKSLLVDLEKILEVIDVDALGDDEAPWVHWCYVAEEMSTTTLPTHRVGAACCDGAEESVRKVQEAILNWVTGRAWDRSAVSRWTATGKLAIRFLIANLGRRVLCQALLDVRHMWRVDASLEKMLTETLKTDPSDWTVRSHLTLIRLCKVLCVPSVVQTLAIMHIGHRSLDNVLYAALGHKREKLTLREFVAPSSSPITKAQTALTGLLTWFSRENPALALLLAVGSDLSDYALRVRCRAHFVRLVSGLVDHFSLRWSRPPYSICLLDERENAATEAQRVEVMNDFFTTPCACQPLLVRRWKARFPSRELLRTAGVREASQFLDSVPTSIDFVERSHTQLRCDLSSDGAGKHRKRSMTRLYCRQLKAAHAARGGHVFLGRDLARAHTSRVRKRRKSTPQEMAVQRRAPRKRQTLGARRPRGSAYIRFLNMRMTAKKQMKGSKALTADEVALVRSRAKRDWNTVGVNGAAHRLLGDAVRFGVQERPRAETPLEGNQFRGVFGSSTTCCQLVDAVAFGRFMKSEACRLAVANINDEEVDRNTITAPPDRMRTVRTVLREVLGCYAAKRNVCRLHVVPRLQLSRFDELTATMTRWASAVRQLEKLQCVAPLLWFRCTDRHEDGDRAPHPRDRLCVAVDFRESPKMQWFVKCGLAQGAEELAVPALPFRAQMLLGDDRLGGSEQHLRVVTSDEVAWKLLEIGESWEVRQLKWRLATDVDDLITMIVEEDLGVVPPPAKKSAAPKNEAALPLLSARTIAAGTDAASHPSRAAAVGGHGRVPMMRADDACPHVGDEMDFEGEELEGLPPEVIDDLAESIDEEHEVDAAATDEPESPSSEADAERLELTAKDFANASWTDENGYVHCDREPWVGAVPLAIGRITSFPQDRPYDQRVHSARCYRHVNCRSPLRKVSVVPELLLLEWLFGATRAEGPTAVDIAAATAMHQDLFRELTTAL